MLLLQRSGGLTAARVAFGARSAGIAFTLPAMLPSRPRSLDPTLPQDVLAVVVGAHLRAETEDRPTAQLLRDALAAAAGPAFPLVPVVVTDLWYLNDQALRAQPTVSVGRPETNALSAYLADKLPSVLAVNDRLIVQLDPDLTEPLACCWGADEDGTAEAAHAFLERWSESFLAAAARAARGP